LKNRRKGGLYYPIGIYTTFKTFAKTGKKKTERIFAVKNVVSAVKPAPGANDIVFMARKNDSFSEQQQTRHNQIHNTSFWHSV